MEQKYELKCKRYVTNDYVLVTCNEAGVEVSYVKERNAIKCAYVGTAVRCNNELCDTLYDIIERCDADVKFALYDVKREMRPVVEDVVVPVTIRRIDKYISYEATIGQEVVVSVFREGDTFSIAKEVVTDDNLAVAGAEIAKALHKDLPLEKAVNYAAKLLGNPSLRDAIGRKVWEDYTEIRIKFPLPPLDVGPDLTPDAAKLRYSINGWLKRFDVERREGYVVIKLPMLCRVYEFVLKDRAVGHAYLCAANGYSHNPNGAIVEKDKIYLTEGPLRFSMYVDVDGTLCVGEQDACIETMLKMREKAFRIYPRGLRSGHLTVYEGDGVTAYRLFTHRWDFLYARLGGATLSVARDNKYVTRVIGLTDFLYSLLKICRAGCGGKLNVIKAAAAGLGIDITASL